MVLARSFLPLSLSLKLSILIFLLSIHRVRATYTSPQEPQVSSAFFELDNPSTTPRRPTESLVLHLTPADLIPTLREQDCNMLDALVHSLGNSTGDCQPLFQLNEDPPGDNWGRDMIQRVCSGSEVMFPLDKLFKCKSRVNSCRSLSGVLPFTLPFLSRTKIDPRFRRRRV